MKTLLLSYDGDGDGKLSRGEVAALIRDADAQPEGPIVSKIMSKMDTDGDGAVSWTEFVTASPQYAVADEPAPPVEQGELLTINRIVRDPISKRNYAAAPRVDSARVEEASGKLGEGGAMVLVAVAVVGVALLAR